MELKAFPPPRWIIVLLLVNTYCSKGSIAPSPKVASVCPGEKLTLICHAYHSSILSWTILIPEGNISRNVPFIGLDTQQSLTLNGTTAVTLNFTRISESGTLPLIAKLQINRVNTDILNETQIHCFPSNESDPRITFIIRVIDLEASSLLHPLEVETHVLDLEATNFTVILNWTQKNNARDTVSYNVSVDPLTELVPIINNSWRVTGSYNTSYNVSIVATLCEKHSITTYFPLEFDTCKFLTKESLEVSCPMLRINNNESRNPAIAGDNVTFYCFSGELMGHNRTTCRSNGEWEPDPRNITCKEGCDPPSPPVNGYILTNTMTSVTFVCQNETKPQLEVTATCKMDGVWEPNPSDHCTSSQSKGINGALVGGVLGILFVAAFVVLAVVVVILVLFKKGSISVKKLCRLVAKQNCVSDHPQLGSQNSVDQAETVMPDDDQVEYAQLNHNLHTVKPDKAQQKTEASSVDDTLNLDTLLLQIQVDVTSRWYQLGEALGMKKELLDRYSSRPPEESIVELLDQWLRSSPEKKKWRDVANALKKIGLRELALDIDKVYETGKLPIDVHMNKDTFPSKAPEFLPPLPSKMKQNTSDSNLISQRQRTLPSKTKQNSDSHLINHHHGTHKQTCSRETLPLQTMSPQPALDSLPAPPLPPKHTAA